MTTYDTYPLTDPADLSTLPPPPPRNPTFVEAQVLIAGALFVQGYVLGCEMRSHLPTHPDPDLCIHGWFAVPATEVPR